MANCSWSPGDWTTHEFPLPVLYESLTVADLSMATAQEQPLLSCSVPCHVSNYKRRSLMGSPFPKLTAEEAAAHVKHGQTVAFSGFTPAGSPKAIPSAIAAKAEAAHQRSLHFFEAQRCWLGVRIVCRTGTISASSVGWYNVDLSRALAWSLVLARKSRLSRECLVDSARDTIDAAVRRNAKSIYVSALGSTVELSGRVHSLSERGGAEDAACAALIESPTDAVRIVLSAHCTEPEIP